MLSLVRVPMRDRVANGGYAYVMIGNVINVLSAGISISTYTVS